MKTLLKIYVPLGSEIMTTLRLATGGVCSLAGLDIDASEDCKVCVTESLLLVSHAGFAAAEIEFSEEDGLCVRVCGAGARGEAKPAAEDEISAALLEALAEGVRTEKENAALRGVSFKFGV